MKCLNSCNSVVHSVSRNGICGMRMHSPIGANVQFCCNYYGISPNDIPYVSKRLAWTVLWNSVIAPHLDKINLIKESLCVKFHKGQISLFSSVRPILHIGEYSLVALQYRRIRCIGLRVSADASAPAAITISSNLTRRLKHMVRVDRMWLQMRPAFLFMFRRTDCRCDTSKHQRHPAALHAAWCFNYRYTGQTHASVSKG